MSKSDLYRILIPSEYQALRDAVPKSKHRILIDTMLNTGMRYEELIAFAEHLSWFDAKNNAISIPEGYTKTKEKRTVHITPAFSKTLSQYLREFKTLEFPARQMMNENLKRWWECAVALIRYNNPEKDYSDGWYPTVKTFRKTWESYLLVSNFPYMAVCASMGHSPVISYDHYADFPAKLKSCMDDVKKLTEGWMT